MRLCNPAVRNSLQYPLDLPPPSEELMRLRLRGQRARLSNRDTDPVVIALQLVGDVLGKRLVFFEPTATDLSFDEAWLLNLFDAVRAGDSDRYIFAMRSRMPRVRASELHFAVCKAAWTLAVSEPCVNIGPSADASTPHTNKGHQK